MKKSQIIRLILDIASEVTKSEVTMNDDEIKIAKKIIRQGKSVFAFLNAQEIEHIINFLFLSIHHSCEEIDECIDFLKEKQSEDKG
jgi:hypothetical protein